jgi:hypothetical protein
MRLVSAKTDPLLRGRKTKKRKEKKKKKKKKKRQDSFAFDEAVFQQSLWRLHCRRRQKARDAIQSIG